MRGDPDVVRHSTRSSDQRAHRDQPVFPARAHVPPLGTPRLADHEHHESIDEMKHADRLDRAHPVPRGPAQPAGPAQAPDRRERPRKRSSATSSSRWPPHPGLKAAIAHCEKVGDYVSREIFEDILESGGAHIDYLETQLELIGKVGLQNWLQSQMGDGDPSGREPAALQRRR